MPFLNPERLARIVAAAKRLDLLTDGSEDQDKPPLSIQIAIVKRELLDAITPDKLLIIAAHPTDANPIVRCWCMDESDAREYLEHANDPAGLKVWELSREGNDATDITVDFCMRWADCFVDYTVEDFDEFTRRMPEFIRDNAEDVLEDMWRQAMLR